jgi:upstream activation factor subunit UAF30
MPKQSKTTSAPVQTENVVSKQKVSKKVDAVPEPVVLAPGVETVTKVKKVKAPKVTSEIKVEASATPVVAVDAPLAVVAPVEENVDSALNELSLEFVAKIQQLSSLVSSLKNDFRTLEKKYQREIKLNQKKNSIRVKRSGTRAPSGFVKPTLISDELANFLDKPTGSEMARTEVTRDINTYIRSHNLQDKANGRKINPDTKLASLLKLTDKDELTYFNLQKYMSPHFAKSVKAEVSSN